MKRIMGLFLAVGLLALSGCAAPGGSSGVPGSGSAAESHAETRRITPCSTPLDVNALAEDASFHAAFSGSGFRQEDGQLVLDLTVYDLDLYDAVDISRLAVGDTLVVHGQEVPVTSLAGDGQEINGGLENGGISLVSAGGGTFRIQLENDAEDLFAVGRLTLPVDPGCVLTDDADPANPGKLLYAKDLSSLGTEVFSPNATTVELSDGKISAIHRDYMP